MKVLHVSTSINRGGAENHLVELVRGQRARGLQVAVAYLKGDGYWARELKAVYPLRLKFYGDPGPWLRLHRVVKELRPDIVHAHLEPAELYARLALLGLPRPPAFVITKHNDEPFYRGPGGPALGRWVARPARRIIAISDAVKRYFADLNHVVTVHYGIDPSVFSNVAPTQSFSCPPGGWIIGSVARLAPQKALHVLLEGYALYRQRATRPSRLVIVGTGPLQARLQAQAAALGIAGEVQWAGFRDDIPQVLAAFDLFALTSAYEGFGLVLLEAMAAGKAVLATRVSAIPEVVLDGVTGKLVAAGRPAEVASALLELESPELRARLGAAGRRRAAQDFSLERMVERTLEAYADAR